VSFRGAAALGSLGMSGMAAPVIGTRSAGRPLVRVRGAECLHVMTMDSALGDLTNGDVHVHLGNRPLELDCSNGREY